MSKVLRSPVLANLFTETYQYLQHHLHFVEYPYLLQGSSPIFSWLLALHTTILPVRSWVTTSSVLSTLPSLMQSISFLYSFPKTCKHKILVVMIPSWDACLSKRDGTPSSRCPTQFAFDPWGGWVFQTAIDDPALYQHRAICRLYWTPLPIHPWLQPRRCTGAKLYSIAWLCRPYQQTQGCPCSSLC